MDKEAFLVDYERLCRTYGLYIWACGCCDSPDIEDFKIGDPDHWFARHMEHLQGKF